MRRAALTRVAAALLLVFTDVSTANAVEDIEFVAEHLAELPMDNRFASLPVWRLSDESGNPWSLAAQGAYSSTSSGNLNNAGPLISIGLSHTLDSGWDAGALVFFDTLDLSGNADFRPLQTDFFPDIPLTLPVAARFDDLNGSEHHYGGGVFVGLSKHSDWVGEHRWVGGLIWQRVELNDFDLAYQILEGPDADVSGSIGFDAVYKYITPFIGLELSHRWTRWSVTPHVLAAWPFSKHGVEGHITGPGFDFASDSATAGHGKHIGDASLTIGLDITYLPANFTIDAGSIVTQYLVEPYINKGIEANWLVSCRWQF
jgi:hypothetical protein